MNSNREGSLLDRRGLAGSSVDAERRFNVKSRVHLIGISDISAEVKNSMDSLHC